MVQTATNKIIWVGAFIIILIGTFSHFIFDLSGHNKLIACFVPVNESVWEHFKLGYLGIVLSCLYDYKKVKQLGGRFYFTSKVLGLLSQALLIVLVYYTYKQFYSGILVWLDILSFIMGAFICQIIVVKFIAIQTKNNVTEKLSLIMMAGIGFMIAWFTFHPPEASIFRDNNTNTYGIYKTK